MLVQPLTTAVLLMGTAIGGCVHYQPIAIAPEANLARLESRSLLDHSLAQAVRATELFPVWPPPSWDLAALTTAALYYNPSLEVARADWEAARSGTITAAERPNPTVNTGPGYNADTPPGTLTPWIQNLSFDLSIETARKRGHRITRAAALSEAARLNLAAAAWQVRSALRKAFLELYTGAERSKLLERQLAVQERNVTLMQRQLAFGEISAFELTQARLALDDIRIQLADAERLRREAHARVASAIGVPEAALESIPLTFQSFERLPQDVPATDAQRAALTNRADVLAALASYNARQSALQLEIARQYPDIHLGPGFQMDQDQNKWTVVLTSVLPILNRNRGAIAEAEARRASAAAALTAAQARAIGELETALAGFVAALDKLDTAEQMLENVRALGATSRARLISGEIAEVDLGVVQLEVTARELSRLDALVQAQTAYGAVEDAMQRPADLPFALPPTDSVIGADATLPRTSP